MRKQMIFELNSSGCITRLPDFQLCQKVGLSEVQKEMLVGLKLPRLRATICPLLQHMPQIKSPDPN